MDNSDFYRVTASALASSSVGVVLVLFGFYVLVRERATRTGLLFFLFTVCVGIWLVCFGFLYASTDYAVALRWLKAAYVGVTFIPASGLGLALSVVGARQASRGRKYLTASIVLSMAFLAAAVFTDTQIKGLTRYPWGYYPLLAPAGILFLAYFAAASTYILRLFWTEYRLSTSEASRKRFRGLLLGFGIGYIASADFIGDFGIPLYPIGFLVIIPSLLITAYVINRYRLIDLTPELAAEEILETMQDAVLLIDLDGTVRAANRKAQGLLAVGNASILGRDVTGLIELPEPFRRFRDIRSPLAAGELFLKRSGGAPLVFSLSAQPVRIGREVYGVVLVAHDVTERTRAAAALRESEERFRALSLASFEGILISENGIVRDCNDQMTSILGCAREELFEGSVLDFIDPESRSEALQVLSRDGDYSAEVRLQRGDGSPRTVEMRGTLLQYRGRECRFIAVRDITERRRMEAALHEGEALLTAVVESSADAIFVKDLDGRYQIMNKAWSHLTGRNPGDMQGLDDTALFPPSEAECVMNDDRRIIVGRRSVMYEHVLTMQGEPRVLQVRKGPIFDRQQRVVGVYGISRDITDRKRFEEALQSSETRFRAIIENAPAGVAVVDAGTRTLRYVNPFICGMLGFTERDLLTAAPEGSGARSELSDLAAGFLDGRDAPAGATERVLHRRDGSEIWTSVNSVGTELDKRPCAVVFLTDISEKRLLEEERSKVQKLDAIGTLAGGIAHDFNNLLQGLFGYISLAKLSIDDREECTAALDQAERALHMTVKLTNQLLTFSKGGKPVKKPVAILPVIENAAKFALSGSRTGCRIDGPEDLWRPDADEGQIGQMIQNIVLNADQAMPDGGDVVITARNVGIPGPDMPQSLAPGSYVMITVADTGVGIPEQYRSRIFDPYYTTKEKGSGLGLATSYSIVRNHDGMIEVDSEPGKGSRFTIYLPARPEDREATERDAPAAGDGAPARRGKVLVMDDDSVIRDVAVRMLNALGHTVELAERGEEALEKYAAAMRSGRPFDLVILDLTVRGGMGGAETIEKLFGIDPRAQAVVSSGYSDDPVTSRHRELGFKAFLKKPYNVREMRDVLDRLLGRSTASL